MNSKPRRHEVNGYVYFGSFAPGYLKIGFSVNPITRLWQWKSTICPADVCGIKGLRDIGVFKGTMMDEQAVHVKLGAYRIRGCMEWYKDCDMTREITSQLFSDLSSLIENKPFPSPSIDPTSDRLLSATQLQEKTVASRFDILTLLSSGLIPGEKVRYSEHAGRPGWVIKESEFAKCQNPDYWKNRNPFAPCPYAAPDRAVIARPRKEEKVFDSKAEIPSPFMSVQEYADYYGVHRNTVTNWIRDGIVVSIPIAGKKNKRAIPRPAPSVAHWPERPM